MNGLLTKLIKLQTMKLYIRLMYLSHLILDIVVLFSFTDIFRCLIIYSHVSCNKSCIRFLDFRSIGCETCLALRFEMTKRFFFKFLHLHY